ncbi:MAG: hypothetical protein ACFCU7_20095 [Pleurocapsa sp.]
MTTIVKHRRTGNQYILLAINGEVGKANPSRFINELFNQQKSEVSASATVCDVQGNIFLTYIDDLVVTQINGKKPDEILPEPEPVDQETNDYPEQSNDFEDEELEEELDNAQDLESAEPKTSFIYGQGSSAQSNIDIDNDDEDWI